MMKITSTHPHLLVSMIMMSRMMTWPLVEVAVEVFLHTEVTFSSDSKKKLRTCFAISRRCLKILDSQSFHHQVRSWPDCLHIFVQLRPDLCRACDMGILVVNSWSWIYYECGVTCQSGFIIRPCKTNGWWSSSLDLNVLQCIECDLLQYIYKYLVSLLNY